MLLLAKRSRDGFVVKPTGTWLRGTAMSCHCVGGDVLSDDRSVLLLRLSSEWTFTNKKAWVVRLTNSTTVDQYKLNTASAVEGVILLGAGAASWQRVDAASPSQIESVDVH